MMEFFILHVVFGQHRELQIFRSGAVINSFPVSSIDSVKISYSLNVPASVSAQLQDKSIILLWGAVQGAISYQLYRSRDNVTYSLLANDVEGTTYVDTSPLSGTNYYKVKAIGQNLESLFSEASAPVRFYDTYGKHYVYYYTGSILYVAYNDGDGNETIFQFNKCMGNNLFTFSRVGYRKVDRNYPIVADIHDDTSIVILNQTGSDNIGPILMKNGGWVGGNHHYPDERKEEHTIYKTAQTDKYHCFADGIEIVSGESGMCDDISILVTNSIFDPAFAPSEGDDILGTLLCKEYAIYRVIRNSIEVSLSHHFVSSTTNGISNYYGMQSMFINESHLLTPNGEFISWKPIDENVIGFTKQRYPYFNRFIEKSSQGYQATFLNPTSDLGKHSFIADSERIFLHSGSKAYHRLVRNLDNIAGRIMKWSGTYTFFKTAMKDDNEAFVYRGSIEGKDALFISVSQSFLIFCLYPPTLYRRACLYMRIMVF